MRHIIFAFLVFVSGVCHADLLNDSTPAERDRGCSWADSFRSQESVEDYGAEVNGAPAFDARDGVTLDGSNDYLQYDLTGTEFDSDEISIVVEFTPNFEPTEDAYRYLYESHIGGSDYYTIVKFDDAGSNTLSFYLGGTCIEHVSLATYSSAWRVNQRNTIVLSSSSGDTSAWLNGTKIIDANTTAWTLKSQSEFYLGSSRAATSKFKGTIHRLQVYKTQLSDAEAEDICGGTTYDYLNKAIVFPMTAAHGTAANVYDASDTYEMTIHGSPRKLAGRGYEFDGSSDGLTRSNDDTFGPHNNFSVFAVAITEDISAGQSIITGKWVASTGNRQWRLFRKGANLAFDASKNGSFGAGSSTTFTLASIFDSRNILCVGVNYKFISDGSSEMQMHVQEGSSKISSAVGPVYNGNSEFEIGSGNVSTGYNWDGTIFYVVYIPDFLITRLQYLDLRGRVLRSINATY